MECVNLRSHFGQKYKVGYEESYYAQYGPNARVEDPWLMIIPCQRGVQIYPWDQSTLAVSTETETPESWIDALMAIPSIRIHQAGDDGFTLLFDIEDFEQVAQIVKPRRRRRLSDEQRAAAAERLRSYQPAKGQRVAELVRP
jgi:hypothetical protein